MVAASLVPFEELDHGFFSDDDDEPVFPFNVLPFPIMPAKSSELNVVEPFDGTGNARNWLLRLQGLARQFGWESQDSANAAQNKLVGDAQTWLRGLLIRGRDLSRMEDRPAVAATQNDPALPFRQGFANAFLRRFDDLVTEVAACHAVTNLKQEEKESVDKFHDRVILALDIKNHGYTAAQKLEASYQANLDLDLYTFFGAGLKPAIQAATLGAASPPKTIDDLLAAARTVEKSMEKKKPSAETAAVSQKSQPQSSEDIIKDLVRKVEALTTRSTNSAPFAGTCYGCGKQGHKRDVCRSGGRGRGRGNFQNSYRGGQQNRGQRGYYRGGNNYNRGGNNYNRGGNTYNQGSSNGNGWNRQNVHAMEQQDGFQQDQSTWCFNQAGNEYGGH